MVTLIDQLSGYPLQTPHTHTCMLECTDACYIQLKININNYCYHFYVRKALEFKRELKKVSEITNYTS